MQWIVPAPFQAAVGAKSGFRASSYSQRNTIKSLCCWETCSVDSRRDLFADSDSYTD